ncbi:FKBP-type peptidyl-prolyl cis-trans isomerase [Photobacterium damselae]|uniref:peptidylprolyl isomerase n=1 Tax=Photobacterium damselae subsp. damselae TaxID=85581 RepID=E4WLK9_PHODD|nr:FKBP-type peptidyl-prolyl cis-trans isomerase [Photobacterium damselae]CBX86927.1 Cell division trigger factor [Photobacterium damselae subsp. damselae]SPY31300.1 Trigger factor [Photobacterium damselae]
MQKRPAVPDGIKREVRQRCGFGCVICGFPLYEYEHMMEWAEVKRHVADEITLLCREHHGMKTDGLLPKQDVLDANANPYNLQIGTSKNVLLRYSGKYVAFYLGDSCFRYENLSNNSFFAPLVIDGLAMVGFRVENDKLLLNFVAFDELNKPIVNIVDNEMIYDTNQWDIEWVAQTLTVREGKGKILLQLKFEPPGIIRFIKGRVLRNGVEFLVGKDYFFNSNNSNFFGSISTNNCAVGIAVGDPLPNCGVGIAISGINRYLFDRKEARQFLRQSLNKKRVSITESSNRIKDPQKPLKHQPYIQPTTWLESNTPVQSDSRVVIDFEGFIDSVPFEGGKAESFVLQMGQGRMIPGFEDGLIGRKVGDSFDVHLSFPSDYHAENLKGKSTVFHITIHKIENKVLAA